MSGVRTTVIFDTPPAASWNVRLRGMHVSGKAMEINATAVMSYELARQMADTVIDTIALMEDAV